MLDPNKAKDAESVAALKKRIASEQRKQDEPVVPVPQSAFHVSVEIVAGILVGGLMGYYLDEWFDTKPAFFIVCIIFGVAASFYNIYKAAVKYDKALEESEAD